MRLISVYDRSDLIVRHFKEKLLKINTDILYQGIKIRTPTTKKSG